MSFVTNSGNHTQPAARFLLASLFCLLAAIMPLWAAQPAAATAAPSPPPSPSASVVPTPVPLADVVAAADAASDRLNQTQTEVAANHSAADIGRDLATLVQEINTRLDETNHMLAPGVPLETLRDLDAQWQKLAEQLAAWARELTERATFLDRELARLPDLRTTWRSTAEIARSDDTPPELMQRIDGVLKAIGDTQATLEKRRGSVLSLQTRVAEQTQRVAGAVRSLRMAQSAAVNRLWAQDSPPLWSPELRAATPQALIHEGQASFGAQVGQVRAYLQRSWTQLIYFALLFAALAFILRKVKQRAARWTDEDPALAGANRVLQLPIATAMVLTFLFCRPIFPEAPRLFLVTLATIALVPIIILLRRLVDRHLFPILNALVVFYFLAQLRGLAAGLPVLSRIMLLLETIGGGIFLLWFIRSTRRSDLRSTTSRKLTRAGARIGVVLFGIVVVTNSLGYVALANYLAAGALGTAYLAILLYAAAGIVEGLSFFALQIRPLASLAIVQQHRVTIRRRIAQIVVLAAFVSWILLALGAFSLRGAATERVSMFLNADLGVRSLHISLGAVLAFLFTIWLTLVVSRFLRFMLEEEVYARIQLARGSAYAVSTVLHYIILLVGFFAALAAVGVDMTKFAILAGAFGVGIGFGLQNIFNNFFSGLILLFERPVQVGDVIEVGNATGVVRRIGIRASIIMLADKTQLIVPNGQLISEKVSNRTVSSRHKAITFAVRVAYGSDPAQVIELLTKAASEHPSTSEKPEPAAFLKEFGADALLFEVTFTTEDVDHALRVQSDVAIAVSGALREAGIEIPLPQRTVHLERFPSAQDKALRSTAGNGA
ncbi:MAG: mechanosensitive ion channel domain-containing protein [Chthoniobacterales bacterium]